MIQNGIISDLQKVTDARKVISFSFSSQKHMCDSHGNIMLLEHINLNTDQPENTLTFFVDGLGCVQDPRRGELIDGNVYFNSLIWVNAGINQFHLPITTRGAGGALYNKLNGKIGLAYDNLDELENRLQSIVKKLENTKFSFSKIDDKTMEITGPLGNEFIAHHSSTGPEYQRDTRGYHPGEISFCLGIPYVEIYIPKGSASKIKAYYENYLGAKVQLEENLVKISTGPQQKLIFRENDTKIIDVLKENYENAIHGYHIAIYLKDYLYCMKKLSRKNLIWGSSRFLKPDTSLGTSQFRVKDIIDPLDDLRKPIIEFEHEIRCVSHSASPFNHPYPHLIIGRNPVCALVSTVSDEFELDFTSIRKEICENDKSFVSLPPGSNCIQPIDFYFETYFVPVKIIIAFLKELQIPHNIHIISDSHDFYSLAPFLRDTNNGKTKLVTQVHAIIYYLLERYGDDDFSDPINAKTSCLTWLSLVLEKILLKEQCDEKRIAYFDDVLASNNFISNNRFSIADIAIFYWLISLKFQPSEAYPNLQNWFERIQTRSCF